MDSRKLHWLLSAFLQLLLVLIYAQMTLHAQPLPAYTATGQRNMKATQISVRDGLSQGLVNRIDVDADSYLWLATDDGLNRYDGATFKIFHYNPDDSFAENGNYLHWVRIDRENRVWASTRSGRLDLFDRRTESFIHVPGITTTYKAPDTDWVGSLWEDNEGHIIIRTGSGFKIVYVTTPRKSDGRPSFKIRDFTEVYPSTRAVLAGAVYGMVKFIADGTLAIRTIDSVYVFTKEALAAGTKPVRTAGELINHLRPGWHEKGIYVDSAHRVIKKFDAVKKEFVPVYKVPDGIQVRMPFVDKKDRLWLHLPDGNMLRITIADEKADLVEIDKQGLQENLKNACSEITDDREGNFFMTTNGYGVVKISAASEKFRIYHEQTNLWCFSMAGKGRVFSTHLRNLWEQTRRKMVAAGRDSQFYEISQLAGYDRKGDFWSYARRNGSHCLVKIDPRKATLSAALCTDAIIDQPVIVDNHDDIWYTSVAGSGVAYFNHYSPATGKHDSIRFPVKEENRIGHFILDWHQQENDVFWLGTKYGIFSFDPHSKTFKLYAHQNGDKKSLSAGIVRTVYPDPTAPQRYIWAGVAGSGLNKMDIKDGSCTHYTTADGLPNNVVYGILPDAHKNLWLSTNNGLCLFYTSSGTTRTFSVEEGLPHNEFNSSQFARDSAGKLYFGGIGGWLGLEPEDFYGHYPPSKVVIDRLEVQNGIAEYSLNPGNISGFRLPAAIEQCKELVFGPETGVFTIGYAAVDLGNQESVRYKYILEGFNNDWVNAGNRREATFTNINPGTYTFKVLARNSNFVWSTVPAELKIIILPPWWGTWWFRTIVAITLVSIVYLLYRYRVNQLLKVERLRNTIALNLHDDIGSSLSSISLYAAVLKKKAAHLSDDSPELLDRLIANTTETMENMNDIVWATKEDMSSFENVIDRMRTFAVEMTELAAVKLMFDVDEKTTDITFKMQQRKNIYMFYKEAVNNAIRHSGCSCLKVSITYEARRLTITVQDNGKGFEYNDAMELPGTTGNGLLGMKFRAEQINAVLKIISSPGGGTTVSLLVPVR